MKKARILSIIVLVLVTFGNAKTVPSAIWPQKDVKSASHGDSVSAQNRILIVGTSSPFKAMVINELFDSLKTLESAYVSVDGLKRLKKYTVAPWKAIVIINTCMAWQIDNKVQDYLKKNSDYSSFIVLTTSGDPDECGDPSKNPPNIDAISSASVDEKRTDIVNDILLKIRQLIN